MIDAVIYSSVLAIRSSIEVLPCSACHRNAHRFAGPDCGGLQLFNFNNKILFTHELLNEYQNRSSLAELPFESFRNAIQNTYQTWFSEVEFVREDVFRDAYFGFLPLQQVEHDFTCPICGPTPDEVIVDGTSVSFHSSRVTNDLHPPTRISSSAPLASDVKPPQNQVLVDDKALRNTSLRFWNWRNKNLPLVARRNKGGEIISEEELKLAEDAITTKSLNLALKTELQGVVTELRAISDPLGMLFDTHVRDGKEKPGHQGYMRLLRQVGDSMEVLMALLTAYNSCLHTNQSFSWFLSNLCQSSRGLWRRVTMVWSMSLLPLSLPLQL